MREHQSGIKETYTNEEKQIEPSSAKPLNRKKKRISVKKGEESNQELYRGGKGRGGLLKGHWVKE